MGELEITPLNPHLAAEVHGPPLDGTPSNEVLVTLRAALAEHGVLVLRVPELRPEQQLAIARFLGEPETHTFYPNLGGALQQVTIIDSRAGDRADMWHHDESFLPSPPAVTMTQAKVLPPCGGDTCWASMTAAYEALSASMQRYLSGLSAWHDMLKPMTAAFRIGSTDYDRFVEVVAQQRRFKHPLVRVHPVTGRRALYVNPTYVTHIDGVPAAESQAILEFLYQHSTQIQFIYRHRWQVGDLVVWDNRSVIHNAIVDYQPHRRRMQRVSVFIPPRGKSGSQDGTNDDQ